MLTEMHLNPLRRAGVHGVMLVFGIGIGIAIANLLPGHRPQAPSGTSRKDVAPSTQAANHPQPAAIPPWGELETIEFPLEFPDESLELSSLAGHARQWRFPNQSLEGVRSLLCSCGLTKEEAAQFLEGAEWQATVPTAVSAYVDGFPLEDVVTEGIFLAPAPSLVLNLSASVRRRIYSALAASELNPGHRYPFRFRPEVFRTALAQADLPKEKAVQVRQLAYKDEGTVCLADVSVLNGVLTTNEFSRLLKSLHQVPTMVLRVRVPSLDEVGALVQYWGGGGREQIIEPFLEGLARVPGPKSVSVSFFLPAFARTRLYTFPAPGTAPLEPRQDCLWTALNFFNDQPDSRLLEREYAERAFRTGFERKPDRPSYGDLVLLATSGGASVHMGVYIADDVMFTKSGVGSMQAWVLKKIPDAMIQFQSLGAVQPLIYTRKSA
jgi:hypothetical protein